MQIQFGPLFEHRLRIGEQREHPALRIRDHAEPPIHSVRRRDTLIKIALLLATAIGLLGGMSPESSIEYERLINVEVRRRLGGVHSADLIMRSYDFAIVEALQIAYPALDARHLAAHSDIAPGRKTDPGPAFDWLRLYDALADHS